MSKKRPSPGWMNSATPSPHAAQPQAIGKPQYLARLPKEGGKDLVMKVRRLRIHLVPFLSDMPLSNIKTFDVERYKKHRLQEEAKHGTINRELAALSHLFTKVLEWGWIDKRLAVIKRFQEDSGRIIYLTAAGLSI